MAGMIVAITRDVVLVWYPELPATTRAAQVALRVGDQPLRPPYAMFSAPRSDASHLGIAVLARCPPPEGIISVTDGLGVVHRSMSSAGLGLADLLARLAPSAKVALLGHLLETLPRFFRESGPELPAVVARVLDASAAPVLAVSAAFDLGDGVCLLRCAAPAPPAATGHYRVDAQGVRAAPGPLDGGGRGEHWVASAVGAAAPGSDLLVGTAGTSAWRIRLNDVRPLPVSALLRYLEGLDPAAVASLLQALQRWHAASTDRSAKVAAVIEDCSALFNGAGPERRAAARLGHGIDAVVPVPGGGVLIRGWLLDPQRRTVGFEAVDCTGRRIPLPVLWPIPHAAAAQRWTDAGYPAPERAGFVGFADGGTDGPWHLDLVLASGLRIALALPPAERDPLRARDQLLASLPASAQIDGAITQAIAPAVERLHAAHMACHPVGSRVQARVKIGGGPAAVRASLVIPLYRNLNFLTFQCAAFAADPALADVEIVYVLDSPEQAGYLEGRLRGEHLIYRMPVTMVVHSGNFGFAAAVNTGARVASGRDLVFLNSDVIPEQAGWLDPLLAALQRPGIGAAAPQLLYLDDSLQFAGLYFDRDADGVWFNRHIAKGFPRSHPAAGVAREVPALTGACLAVRRAVFEQAGGFDEGYVIGDFEDSDLCLRLRSAGLACWYEPAASLFHVERQSIDRHEAHGKSVATMVNRWRQQQRWGVEIEALMRDREARWGLPASLMPEIERLA